jgi:caa(3)-type oxidase subunit IV
MATSTHTHEADHSHSGGHHHITPMRQLVVTFALLVFLMAATIIAAKLPYWFPGQAGWMNSIPILTNGIAIGIALWKAGLVVQTFMGVKFSTNLVKFYAYGGFLWFLLMGMILIDYFSRPFEPVQGWEKAPSTGLPRDAKRVDGMDPNFQPYRPEKKDSHGSGH